jgi:hypothetical protein
VADQAVAIGDLPLRPAFEPGESLPGYLYRAYALNGHRVPLQVMNALKRPYGREPARHVLRAAVNDSEAAMEAWELIARMRARAVESSRSLLLPVDRVAYCPACLRARKLHRLIWQMPGVWACPEHGCKLVCRCQGCDEWLTWEACRPNWQCRCGARLSDGKSEGAADYELFVARVLERSFFNKFEAGATDLFRSLMDGVEVLQKFDEPSSIGLAEAAHLFHRLMHQRSVIAFELFRRLHKLEGRFFVHASGRLLRLIDWANDPRRRWSSLRAVLAAALRDLISERRVLLPLDKTLLYAARSSNGPVPDLLAFERWFVCWHEDMTTAPRVEPELLPGQIVWDGQDEVIADILLALHRAFKSGEDGCMHRELFNSVASDESLLAHDARHLVANIWMRLRAVHVVRLREYLAVLLDERRTQAL